MKLRSPVQADLPALISILRNSWLTTWAPELSFATVQRFAAEDPARHYAETMWREFIVAQDSSDGPDDDAEHSGAVVGMFHVEGNCLDAIHLDPKRKRQGIGSRLMDEVERRISAEHPEARLEVRAFNTGAIKFYQQRGWTERRRYQATECGEPVETLEMVKVFAPRK